MPSLLHPNGGRLPLNRVWIHRWQCRCLFRPMFTQKEESFRSQTKGLFRPISFSALPLMSSRTIPLYIVITIPIPPLALRFVLTSAKPEARVCRAKEVQMSKSAWMKRLNGETTGKLAKASMNPTPLYHCIRQCWQNS